MSTKKQNDFYEALVKATNNFVKEQADIAANQANDIAEGSLMKAAAIALRIMFSEVAEANLKLDCIMTQKGYAALDEHIDNLKNMLDEIVKGSMLEQKEDFMETHSRVEILIAKAEKQAGIVEH
jgi:hypothetical protein